MFQMGGSLMIIKQAERINFDEQIIRQKIKHFTYKINLLYNTYSKRKGDNTKMKKLLLVLLSLVTILILGGCESQADRVSHNLSKEADNFNVVRQLTVINCIEGDVLFQMTGKMSIYADTEDNQLEIIVEDNGKYKKHFVGLSDNVTYVVEDIDTNDVSKYRYTLNYNPKMWIPVEFKNID